MTRVARSSLIEIIELFRDSFTKLNVQVSSEFVEECSLRIHTVMTGRSRAFHQVDHVLEVSRGLSPLERLAAVYHDLVYYQVDRGFGPGILERIGPWIEVQDDRVWAHAAATDLIAEIPFRVFGVSPGSELPLIGKMNEFLSALVAVRDLGQVLNAEQLAVICACIEATIPFRAMDSEGLSAPEALGRRLEALAQDRGWNWNETKLTEVVQASVRVGNADVANFAFENAASFLDNTWMLLPESNPDLQVAGAYTIRKYRTALQKMEGFLSSLNASVVFHEYRGVPEKAQFEKMKSRAAVNLRIAVKYLQAKLLPVATLEALAELTGGDAPFVLLLGPGTEGDPNILKVQDLLPPAEGFRTADFVTPDAEVYPLLAEGRSSTSSFDLKSSPLAAYLARALGQAGLDQQVERAKDVFRAKSTWLKFLKGLPPQLVEEFIRAVSAFAITRQEKLAALAGMLR